MAQATPRLDALLSRLRAALVRSAWLHGLGTVLAAAAGWLLVSFLIDWLLHVPAPVRVFHTVVLVALPLVLLVRQLARPLRRIPERTGLAVLADRARRVGDDLFVSATSLSGRDVGEALPLVQRVVREAEAAADSVDLEPILDPAHPRRRAWLAAFAVLVTGLSLGARPDLSGIYLARMLGADVPWPQRTNLFVDVPLAKEYGQVQRGEAEIMVRAARGTDIPVLVRAEGEVPSEIFLEFVGGRESAIATGGGTPVRTTLRSVQQDLEFRVRGGDDNDGEPLVRIQVLEPPDVAGIAFQVTPPAYTGIPARLTHATEAEVLAGSRVRVHLLPDPADASGSVQLSTGGVELPLEAWPYTLPDGSTTPGLGFELEPTASLRFSVKLLDSTGLPNPDPGLFGITVREDRRPELSVIAPARAELDVTAGGAVPLRVRVQDDFGLRDLRYDVRPPSDLETLLSEGALEMRKAQVIDEATLSGRDVRVAAKRLEVDALGGSLEPMGEGSQVQLQLVARDNRDPDPGIAQSPPIRLRVVSGDEYLRRLKDDLARAGERAGALAGTVAGAEVELRELLALLGGDGRGQADGGATELAYGARRIEGDARALGRELAGLAEGLLYSRLDPRGGALLEALDTALAATAERGFQPEPWRALAADYSAGRLSAADLAGDLVVLVGLSLSISEEHARLMAELLESDTLGDEQERVAGALASAERARVAAEELVTRLGEWDNMQSVLTLIRDISTRQKNLNERTKKFAEDH